MAAHCKEHYGGSRVRTLGFRGGCAAVPLNNWRHPEFRFDGDYVHFKMDDNDGAVVYCAVMADYLDARAALAGITGQGCRALFTLYRSDIEAIASAIYDRGNERPVVTPGELYAHINPTASPASLPAPPLTEGQEA